METIEIIKKSVGAATAASLKARVDSLLAEEKRLLEPRYRVAFVGQFKTGKSTLINRVILKSNILFTDVLEATSIPTEIDYSEKPRLEVYRYEKKTFSVHGDGHQVVQDYISGSVLDRSIEDPTLEQIQKATSGDSPEARAALASDYSHARLFWPAKNLMQFTVVDTPGINTTNDAVVTTTYRILPECDATIFVAHPRALGQVDIEFLRGRVFESGITRCMVVLHYDPRFSDISKEQLGKIKEANEAQLKSIGRGGIPVTVAEIARIGGLADGEFGRSAASTTATVEGWLNGPIPPTAPIAGGEILPIERDLLQFIHDNVRPGKEEKIRLRIRRIIETALAECQLELGLIEKSEAERKDVEVKIAGKQQETADNTRALKEDFLNDLRSLQKKHLLKISKALDLLERKFAAEMDTCQSVGEIQTRIRNLKQIMQLETEDLAARVAQEVREEFRELERMYAIRLQKVASSWQEVDVALKIDGGLLEKAPGWLVAALDALMVIIVSPFPFFIDLILRYFANKLPGLNTFLPANMATLALKHFLAQSASQQFVKVREEVAERLETGYSQAAIALSQAWDEQTAEQSSMVSGAVERASKPSDPTRVGILKEAIETFKRLLPELPVTGVLA
jgi:Dynamin family